MTMKCCVIIPAAGSSTRFSAGSKQDKLAQDLGGRPLLIRTVELFTKRPEVTAIVVAGPPDTMPEFKLRYGDKLAFHGAKLVAGGTRARWETVQKALEAVPDDCTHIAVHDAARPAVDEQLLDRLFEAAAKFDAVVPTVAIASTVKRLSEETEAAAEVDPLAARILGDAGKPTAQARTVVETVDRRGLYESQTPEIFKADLLRKAYASLNPDAGDDVTDDAILVERLGSTVHAVDGDVTNVKVTIAGDLRLVRAILGVRPPKDRPVHKRF
ncbi:MAG: 2-C-methyl-D-erythritol 4-phosphate cytidylyltransferase [Planctomycetes bacterium]|nr:2-C-methyl-D-erythritol 4-phosphate cytidylyltransferase [Planctomycetota bacterium]